MLLACDVSALVVFDGISESIVGGLDIMVSAKETRRRQFFTWWVYVPRGPRNATLKSLMTEASHHAGITN